MTNAFRAEAAAPAEECIAVDCRAEATAPARERTVKEGLRRAEAAAPAKEKGGMKCTWMQGEMMTECTGMQGSDANGDKGGKGGKGGGCEPRAAELVAEHSRKAVEKGSTLPKQMCKKKPPTHKKQKPAKSSQIFAH